MMIIDNPFANADLGEYLNAAPELADLAISQALNEVAGDTGLAILRDQIDEEVNFPKGYVKRNTSLSQRATPARKTAVISARGRATSLAEFANGSPSPTATFGPMSVTVKRKDSNGKFKRAKLVRLNNDNIGFALFLPKGERVSNSYGAYQLTSAAAKRNSHYDIYLLYGPSVDQTLSGAFEKREDDFTQLLVDSFISHFGGTK